MSKGDIMLHNNAYSWRTAMRVTLLNRHAPPRRGLIGLMARTWQKYNHMCIFGWSKTDMLNFS